MLKYFILLLSLTAIINCEVTYEDHVAVLNDSNFEQFVQENKYVLVEFYAPWCGHCKQLAPEWTKAAEALEGKEPKVILAKVDATENESLGQKYNIEGFPTIIMFYEGSNYEYNGPRDSEGIVQWILKKVGPIGYEISSEEAFNKIKSDKQVLVLFFLENQDSAEYQVYENLARITEVEYVFYAHTYNKELRKVASVAQEGTQLVIFKQFDDLRADYDGQNWQVPHVYDNFIQKNIYKTILDFDEAGAEKIFSIDKQGLFLLVNENEASVQATQVLESEKNQLKNQITLCKTYIDAGMGERLAEYLDISDEQLPLVLILDFRGDDMDKYFYNGAINGESLLRFVDDYKNNRLSPNLNSEQIPQDNSEPVKVLVGENFEKEVLNQQRDTFVKFYAPWCGHCKSMIPAYEAVAQHFANDENISIAKIDYTKNEVQGLTLEGFPTLRLFPAGITSVSEAIEYESERDQESIIAFINENRKSSVKQSEQKKDDL